MNFTTITLGTSELECRLATKNVVALERKLGTNPLNVLMSMQNGELPRIDLMLTILQESAKLDGKKITMDKLYDLYDEAVAEGKDFTSLLEHVMDIFQVSGLIPEDIQGDDEGKR